MAKQIIFKSDNQMAETPFSPLQQWDRITGAAIDEAKTWRRVAVIAIASFIASLGVLIWAYSLPKKIPVIITLSELGEAKYIGDASKYSYTGITVPEVAIHSALKTFVINTHTIPLDVEVLRQNLENCYAYLTSTTATKFTTRLKAESPFNLINVVRQKVLIESLLNLTKNSYQIDYIIETTRPDGTYGEKKKMRAIFTVKMYEPPADDIIMNPLGIYITDFDFTEVK